MSFFSTDSNISSAEEVIVDDLYGDINRMSEIEDITDFDYVKDDNDINLSQFTSDDITIQDSDGSSLAIYSDIKPDDVHIMNLNVEASLKPDYVYHNNNPFWLGPDRFMAERRKEGIVKYLSGGGNEVIRSMSIDNLRKLKFPLDCTRRGSYDAQFVKNRSTHDSIDDVQSPVSSKRSFNQNDKLSGSDSHATDELEFQASLKNERYHFIFADQLIRCIEVLHAEEYYYNLKQGNHQRSVSLEPLTRFDESKIEKNNPSQSRIESFSSAKFSSMAIIDEVLSLIDQLNVWDGRNRRLPPDLQSLLDKLDKTCSTLSISLENSPNAMKWRPRTQTSSKPQNAPTADEGQSETTEAIIKAAIGSYTLSLTVGGCSILGPDMSLPAYVVSRSQPPAKRSATLFLQQNTCPGCRCAFLPEVARRLRLCHYYELYFCSVCHNNTLMVLPARILTRWDFSMLPVSRPARDFLRLVHAVPLFTVSHFAEPLQSSLVVLATVRRLRRQGRLLLDFIESCRQATTLTRILEKLPPHWFSTDLLLFSVADFRLMEVGGMEVHLRAVVAAFVEHVSLCPVCQARGFHCELCRGRHRGGRPVPIFPFEVDTVTQCALCGQCFHIRCFKAQREVSCPRCERLRVREERLKRDEDDHCNL